MFKVIFLAVAVSAVGIHSAAFQSYVEPLNSANRIERFLDIFADGNAKGLELIKDLDGQGIYDAITDGFYGGNITTADVGQFIDALVKNKVLTKKMLLDFTMDSCRKF
jgi:hypothetical protein